MPGGHNEFEAVRAGVAAPRASNLRERLAAGVRRLTDDTRGVTAIEFALVAPLVVFASVEVCQASLYVVFQATIESATAGAARKVMVGGLATGAGTAQDFRINNLCPLLVIGSCENVVTNLQTATLGYYTGGYRNFIKADMSGLVSVDMDNSKTSYCVGSPGTYQYVQAFYAVPVFSPIWKAVTTSTYQGRQAVMVRAAAAFRNEPYTSASANTGC